MSSVSDIRQGLAANMVPLRTAEVVGHVSAYLDDQITPAVCVAGVAEYDYITFGGPGVPAGMEYLILIEAVLGKGLDVGAQKLLDDLMEQEGATSLVAAVESDQLLTSRLGDDGVVSVGHDPAAESVAFEEYRGQTPFLTRQGVEVLLASWVFKVIT